MTFLVKCDNCGKIQKAGCNDSGKPYNPFDDETGSQWYSRNVDKKEIHACSRECIKKGGVLPF